METVKKDSAFKSLDFTGLRLRLASPEDILRWSYGEVIKPETINYRTQRPEKDGLFSERIFGPTKDWECYCGKYRKVRYRGVICDKCGVEVTRSSVRRERMGHIQLAAAVMHPWFLKSAPSRVGLALDESISKLERVTYHAAYIVTDLDEAKRKIALEEISRELKSKRASVKGKEQTELESSASSAKRMLMELRVGKVLEEIEFGFLGKRFGNVFTVGSGGEGIRKILEGLDLGKELKNIESELSSVKDDNRRKKLYKRLKFFKSMINNNLRPEWMVLTILPVLPPDLRPMVALDGGRYATSDLNDLYRRVINRNNRLKKLLELKAPDVIVINEKRMLQEAVDALIDNSARPTSKQTVGGKRALRSLADMLKGKQGRFRNNLLGKRVDYSGRSVIVVGPSLKIDECGLPKKMALELFRPFVIREVLKRDLAHNIRNANRKIDEATPEIWGILEEIIADKKVLLNRAPTLHRLNIQAFKPRLIEDLCIQLPPLVCAGFNADFDGDQMAVHVPLSDEAQNEATNIMLSSKNLLRPRGGEAVTRPDKDMVLGCYYLTSIKPDVKVRDGVYESPSEAKLAYSNGYVEINVPVKVRIPGQGIIETSVGRIIFNDILPVDYGYLNETQTKNSLGQLIDSLIERYDQAGTKGVLDEIKMLGYRYATTSGISWSMSDMSVPKEKEEIVKDARKEIAGIEEYYTSGLLTARERRERVVEVWKAAVDKLSKVLPHSLSAGNSIMIITNSQARGGWDQIRQMIGMKGVVSNPKNEDIELAVKSSLKEGHTSLEYFITTHGARKGLADTALKTAEAGYLTRRLIDASQSVITKEEDCKTKSGVVVARNPSGIVNYNFAEHLFSRTALEDVKIGRKVVVEAGEVISAAAAREIAKSDIQEVKIRSPLTCKTLYGICSKCYGLDLGNGKPVALGEAVGIIAAQSLGEPGTQLVLRTKHAGGIAGNDITKGLPRVEEIFEVRPPKDRAVLSHEEGRVVKIEDRGLLRVISIETVVRGKKKVVEYSNSRSMRVLVHSGDRVEIGQVLTEGSIDLQELLELKGREEVYRYIMNEIESIYSSVGVSVNNKHLEVIIRQMFNNSRVVDSGDTDFVVGDVVDRSLFIETNRKVKEKGGQPAKDKEVLLGITQSALRGEGWLAAASFQETARVLIRSAVEGRVDRLLGLKENVIIGRLLPIGPVFRGEVPAVTEEEQLGTEAKAANE
ncbi:MAG: DNA-directed RNA polymerase subunit beta' [Patescibacteria group bacterium]|nr:DNA-directed RNA polymerase subunit beta' [Patescibacteria group bacterium]MCL5224365.1 DNA-directed RNA polymerase subunit beta' [Patescibacteria group bacterium]